MTNRRALDVLLARGALDPKGAEVAEREMARSGLPLGTLLVERRWVRADEYAAVVAEITGWPALDPKVACDRSLAEKVDRVACERHGICPVRMEGRRVRVAVVDLDRAGLDELRFRLGREIEPAVTTRAHLLRILRHVFDGEALELLGTQSVDVPGTTPIDERAAIHRLVAENRTAARAVRAIYDLCVARGLVEAGALERRLEQEE